MFLTAHENEGGLWRVYMRISPLASVSRPY
jgi:hypothetical protein